jgi:3'-5' exoribonuclease
MDLLSQPSLDTLPPGLACSKAFVRDLVDGQQIESPFLVRDRTRRERRNGEPFLKLQLGDVTGMVEGVVWDGVDEAMAATAPGSVVMVAGRYEVKERYGACITVRTVREAPAGSFDPADLHDAPPVPFERMVEDLRALVDTIQDRDLRALLDRLVSEDCALWQRWSQWPAAKTYHQAYRHGLLEHCLSVAQGVSAISATFPGIDRDLAVTGALLHDIGKVEAYEMTGGAIELSDAGKLLGEIPLGYYLVRREIEAMPGFAPETAQALLHIILAHHGQLEHGSPVTPCTREATLVHFVDNLGGRLGSFDRLEKSLSDGERWSGFDRALSGSAYFGAARPAAREAA